MLPTVSEVLAMPVMRRAAPRVVAGSAGLSRPVRWVHSAELADIAHLLRGGELVLTTGIALPDDGAALAGYVGELAEVDVAGLVVELGRRWTGELPAALREACEAAGLPLVALRRETRFVTVAQHVGELIVDAQLAELRATEHIHETFTALSVSGAGQSEILGVLVRMAGLPVVLESIRHQILGYDLAGDDPGELLAGWEQRSRAVGHGQRTAYHQEQGWLVTSVGARGDDWGRLVLLAPDEPSRREVVLLERAAAALALDRLATRDRESLERQTHRTLLTALSGTSEPEATVLDRCAEAGVPVRERLLVGITVTPRAVREAGPATLAAQEAVRDLADVASSAARQADVPALIGVTSDNTVGCLLSLPRDADATAVTDGFAARIHRAVAAMPRATPATVAAGSEVTDPAAVRRSIAEADHVAAAAAGVREERPCHRLRDVHVRGLLHLLGDDDRVAAFAERELGALAAYDGDNGTTLLGTLRAFVEHSGNKAAAAAALHLSRPAFYERLQRIERILGADLADPEVRTSLHLAVLASEATRR
ncbi:PucR family transcriptional regulator [Haloechinothrix sp. YIM 98757]|uniref:PucR family transcriptional regulator n=1 Tax=Haloechinothrix aidingensis TaxID=2752311 RepID=A0A838ABH8_9PSEU|nr:PucR family transcriptional regulator [Haloechinothrix aidingensis]MBA0126594.1 PucR family transcriptional regulator [Haloechinothrix aidingensis]